MSELCRDVGSANSERKFSFEICRFKLALIVLLFSKDNNTTTAPLRNGMSASLSARQLLELALENMESLCLLFHDVPKNRKLQTWTEVMEGFQDSGRDRCSKEMTGLILESMADSLVRPEQGIWPYRKNSEKITKRRVARIRPYPATKIVRSEVEFSHSTSGPVLNG